MYQIHIFLDKNQVLKHSRTIINRVFSDSLIINNDTISTVVPHHHISYLFNKLASVMK